MRKKLLFKHWKLAEEKEKFVAVLKRVLFFKRKL